MSYRLQVSIRFQKEAKRLIKKYPSLIVELSELRNSLLSNPSQGVAIKYNCYKIRVAIASKGKGKRSGARVITHVHIKDEKVYLLTIFDKSELDNISEKELEDLLSEIEDL